MNDFIGWLDHNRIWGYVLFALWFHVAACSVAAPFLYFIHLADKRGKR